MNVNLICIDISISIDVLYRYRFWQKVVSVHHYKLPLIVVDLKTFALRHAERVGLAVVGEKVGGRGMGGERVGQALLQPIATRQRDVPTHVEVNLLLLGTTARRAVSSALREKNTDPIFRARNITAG